MARNRFLFFIAIVLGLTMVTSAIVARTYAKYTTTVTATGTVTVAKWVAKLTEDSDSQEDIVNFDLFETFSDTGVDGKLLAPGTSGSFDVYYDTSGTQTARNVNITMNATELSELTFLTFSYSEDGDNFSPIENPFATEVTLLNKDFGPAEDGKGTITVSWEWPFNNNDDEADTEDGLTPITDAEITLTFTATQLDEYNTP